jgi:hypothetical protein
MDSTLGQFLDPATGCLTVQVAERMAKWRPDPALSSRVRELGQKAEAGELSDAEQLEYEQHVDDGDLITLLQLKAREILGRLPS